MLYRLTVVSGSDQGKYADLFPGNFLKVGREEQAVQFFLNDSEVSRCHASIRVDESGSIVINDEGSTNGTYVRNQKLTTPQVVVAGDTIELGNSKLQIQTISESQTFPCGDNASGNNARENLANYPASESRVSAPLAGYERIVYLENRMSIGRDQTNDIVLDHPHVSRFHSSVEVKGGEYFVYDLDSTNGTYVNGERVEKFMQVADGSIIQISGYLLVLSGKEILGYDETEGRVKIEIAGLYKSVIMPDNEERVLLDNVNLTVEPREFVAVLGGSGAGKSTFLKTMMGIWPPTAGEIMINGRDLYQEQNAFRSMIGYVPQDDIVHMELTVEEVLDYAACLRMPSDTTWEERMDRIDEVINILGLDDRRHNIIKQLSGGQRKRVSIGVELLTKPSIFFLDEPTSGLDPGLEKVMMQMMREMANGGQTIFLVTHATFNIHLCDKLLFLTEGGRVAFFGTPRESLAYFGTNDFGEIYEILSSRDTPENWQEKFLSSAYASKYIPFYAPQQHGGYSQEYDEEAFLPEISSGNDSAWQQWLILTSRYTKVMLRDLKTILLLLVQPVFIALLFSVIFLHTAPTFEESEYRSYELEISEEAAVSGRLSTVEERVDEEADRQRNMSLIIVVMVISAVWFGTSNSAREVVKELHIYKRERLVNLQLNPYLLSKVSVLALACLVQLLIFLFIIRAFLGLPSFWHSFLAFFLVSLSSIMMGLTVSAVSNNTNNATTAVPILLIPQLILSGGFIPMEEVQPEIIQHIFYVAISKWGYELIGGSIIDINSLIALDEPIKAFEGQFIAHWWVLTGFVVLLYFISLWALSRKDKELF